MTNTQKRARRRNSMATKGTKEIAKRKIRKNDKISKMRRDRRSLEDWTRKMKRKNSHRKNKLVLDRDRTKRSFSG
jgi:hypothetical protein